MRMLLLSTVTMIMENLASASSILSLLVEEVAGLLIGSLITRLIKSMRIPTISPLLDISDSDVEASPLSNSNLSN
jgi:tetrahydromethanopterin S-methyltransferase subunit C